jgi:hypothetical protein
MIEVVDQTTNWIWYSSAFLSQKASNGRLVYMLRNTASTFIFSFRCTSFISLDSSLCSLHLV